MASVSMTCANGAIRATKSSRSSHLGHVGPVHNERDFVRSTTVAKTVFPYATAKSDILPSKAFESPPATPRSTDAGGSSSPSAASFTDSCSSTEFGGSSESEAGEDGTVRCFFRRVKGICSSVLPFGAQPVDDTAKVLVATDVSEPVPRAPPRWRATDNQRLVASPTSWAAQRRKRSGSEEEASDAEFVRGVRSVLNKLTVERFDALYEKVVACGVKSVGHVALLVREILDKATMQHKFIGMYGDLCVRLGTDSRIEPASEESNDTFRRILLDQCQLSFEQLLRADTSDDGCLAGDEDTREEARIKRKLGALGIMKFIGELIKIKMVSSSLLIKCSQEFLERESCPDCLELLVALLTVAGPAFDQAPGWSLRPQLEAVFRQINALVASAEVPPRTRFLLRDLLDLRAAAWTDKKRATVDNKGPKRLQDVREDDAVPKRERRRMGTRAPQAAPPVRDPVRTPPCKPGPRNRKPVEAISASVSIATQAKVGLQVAEMKGCAQKEQGNATTPTVATESVHDEMQSSRPMDELDTVPAQQSLPFDRVAFRRELVATMKELSITKNVAAAVRRIRAQDVPVTVQAIEFADILTRVAEESRGPTRRYSFAFTAGLANGENSAFDKMECIKGIRSFFQDDYECLCEDVPRLPGIVTSEFIPTLRSVFSEAQLADALPKCFGVQ